uniref:hypothetical protein n=1 Tax=Marinobacterium profundum TaxID=1714300 RepID=UPI000B165EF3|nr:hypothetical protein [Marinobacterium profundum]
MNLSEDVLKKLNQWIKSETWHSDHDLDAERFYGFIDAYEKENGPHISDEAILAETIAIQGGIDTSSQLFDVILERVSLMYTILDFVKFTHR